MNRQHPSPTQIRAQAARAFHARQRAMPPTADQLQSLLLRRLAALAPSGLRMPMPGETPLSPQEITHGLYHGLIGDRRAA